jgi:hypothetical protein
MRFLDKKQLMVTLLAGALMSPQMLSHAQEAPKPPTTQPNKASDAELRAFAKAYVEYRKIRQKYRPESRAAKDPQESKKIQDEANSKVKDALAKQQLTVQNYNRLFTLVNNDESLRKQAMKLIEEERKRA